MIAARESPIFTGLMGSSAVLCTLSLLAISSLLCGCSAAYNIQTVNSPEWNHAVTCYVRGSLGRSYLAETKKKVVVSIVALPSGTKERSEREIKEASAAGGWSSDHNPGAIAVPTDTLLFRKEYRIRGSDIEWTSAWGPAEDITVVFYDYGAGVDVPYEARAVSPKRVLRTIHYEYDSDTGIYREQKSKQSEPDH